MGLTLIMTLTRIGHKKEETNSRNFIFCKFLVYGVKLKFHIEMSFFNIVDMLKLNNVTCRQ